MVHIEINPENVDEEIIKNLNICFPNWGDKKTFDRYFKQKSNSFLPDIILFKNEQNQVIAGSSVSYRKIKIGDIIADIGIMTGSWTLPEARGTGCFSKMIETSKELCKEKGVHYLTAFVTEDNASYRRLKDAGSICLPANNYFLDSIGIESKSNHLNWINIDKLDYYRELIENYYSTTDGFYYDFESFKKQFIDRLCETRIFTFNNVIYIIELAKVVKILFVSEIISEDLKIISLHLSNLFSQKIMWFCSKKQAIQSNLDFLENKNGFFTMIETTKCSLNIQDLIDSDEQSFSIQLGDKV